MIELKEHIPVDIAENELRHLMTPILQPITIDKILAQYRLIDDRHDSRHILDVVKHAVEIIDTFKDELESYRKVIMLGAFMHDIGLIYGRKNHHIHSSLSVFKYLKTARDSGAESNLFTEKELVWISAAAFQHRASLKLEKFHSPAAEAVAAADRGTLFIDRVLQRCFFDPIISKLQRDEGVPIDTLRPRVENSMIHLIEKFGVGGYAYKTLPRYTQLMYNDNINHTSTTLTFMAETVVDNCVKQLTHLVEAYPQ
jgi:hypothetical protein